MIYSYETLLHLLAVCAAAILALTAPADAGYPQTNIDNLTPWDIKGTVEYPASYNRPCLYDDYSVSGWGSWRQKSPENDCYATKIIASDSSNGVDCIGFENIDGTKHYQYAIVQNSWDNNCHVIQTTPNGVIIENLTGYTVTGTAHYDSSATHCYDFNFVITSEFDPFMSDCEGYITSIEVNLDDETGQYKATTVSSKRRIRIEIDEEGSLVVTSF